MAASGVAVRTSKISSEDEDEDASLWRETAAGGEVLCGGSPEMAKLSWRR
jgi:hypothetical protein